ncbi:hypothetical protein N7457_008288 [Penicillium paradoxum]|uniref:uncharacterized protein n=1 Tax=Penicillium paradoxum TaxID=176176 RepID=UPI0025467ADB|nr:uncharacterized protein N7457_008288 [Penicillium paradoxum]KAJ5773392.1 hypothetical protein N7457_008288 [Penicillium paradoxum]
MPTVAGNAEIKFKRRCDRFKVDLQREIDVLTARDAVSPIRLALSVDNLANLIAELSVIERDNAIMCKEMPRCRTMMASPGYYAQNSGFSVNTRKLKDHLVVLKENLFSKHSDRHWTFRQIESLQRYLIL